MKKLCSNHSKSLISLFTGVLLIGAMPFASAAEPVSLLAPGGTGDTTADAVLGQLDFNYGDKNFIDGHGLHTNSSIAGDIAVDTNASPNRVFVVDRDNHRVLGWKSINAFSTHAAADLIIGQPNPSSKTCNYNGVTPSSLCSPSGVAVDKSGNLFIADSSNNRVLFYNKPYGTDTVADEVFGQYGSYYTNYCNNTSVSANSLCGPARVILDSANNLYVSDFSNHRVLVFYSPLAITAKAGSGDTTADAVFGQLDVLNANTCNNTGLSANSLCNPVDIAVDSADNIYVADFSNNRVLEYNNPLTLGTKADRVYGQLDNFTTGVCNNGGINGRTLCGPTSVVVTQPGTVFIADRGNHRVLGFQVGKTASQLALGQFKTLTTNICNNTGGGTLPPVNDKSLCNPDGLAVDTATGGDSPRLYVSDTSNNRVLQYKPTKTSAADPKLIIKNGQAAGGVLGQYLFSANTVDTVDSLGFALSAGNGGTVALDRSVTPNRIYVADHPNHRVLAWSNLAAFASHAPATLVFGQPNPYTNTFNNGGVKSTTLFYPRGLAVDKAGNLYIADQENHRVLGYKTPFTTDTTADIVFGQSGVFTTNFCNQPGLNDKSLCRPVGLAVDSVNNLYVADHGNNRVLEFDKPFSTDTAADKVYGQGGSFTSNGCNQGGVISASSLCNPHGVALDSADNLYVADFGNNRALVFKKLPATDTTADFVFGQLNLMSTNTCNNGGVTADGLCHPRFVAANSTGDVYIADSDNHRVLKYNKPLTTNRTADKVFGQGNLFTLNGCRTISPSTLCWPDGIAVDGGDNLYVGDTNNNRVLQFLKP